jgi:hypothetical protein
VDIVGKQEIFEYLKNKREMGIDTYFSIDKIISGLKVDGKSCKRVCYHCLVLQRFNVLEAKTILEYSDKGMNPRAMRSFRYKQPLLMPTKNKKQT